MSELKVHTAQNVLLKFPIANVGQRILAGFLDFLVMVIYYYLANMIYAAIIGRNLFQTKAGFYAEFFIIVLPLMLYLPVCEYLWSGRTAGKAILNLRVVNLYGRSPSLGEIVLRWLLRTIDVKLGFLFIFFIPNQPINEFEQAIVILAIIFFVIPMPLVGIISMATSQLGQRIGDRVANTAVIKYQRRYSLKDTILKLTDEEYIPQFTNVLKLRDKDIHIIKMTLDEAAKTRNHKNVVKLAEKAREILEVSEDNKMKPLNLLQTILSDYNHLAKERDLKN